MLVAGLNQLMRIITMKFEDALHSAKNNIEGVTTVQLQNLSLEKMNEFALALATNTTIKTIQLTHCAFELDPTEEKDAKIPPYALASLAQAVSRPQPPPTLTNIWFENCSFLAPFILRTPATDHFLTALANNQSVTELCIENTADWFFHPPFRVNPGVLRHLVATNRTLQALVLMGLLDVKEVEDGLYNGFVSRPQLQKLALVSCGLGSLIRKPTALLTMISKLKERKDLLDLSGGRNYYSENDIEDILLALEKNPMLDGLAFDITSSAQMNRVLHVLSRRNTGLKRFGICNANFNDMPNSVFYRLPKDLPGLTFFQCSFTKGQFSLLMQNIEQASDFGLLRLLTCQLTDEQVSRLLMVLATHPALHTLSLLGNELSDGCAEQLISFIKTNRHLVNLDLRGNGFSAKTLQALRDEVSQHTNITSFKVDGIDDTVTKLNVQLEKALSPFSFACELGKQSPGSHQLAMRLNLIPSFIQSHQNLRQLITQYPNDVHRIEAELSKLERDSLEIVHIPQMPIIARLVIAVTALTKQNVNSNQFKSLLKLIDDNKDAFLQNFKELIDYENRPLDAASPRVAARNAHIDIKSFEPRRLYVALVLSIYQVAYEKNIHLTTSTLLTALNMVENSDHCMQVIPPAEMVKRIKQLYPAALTQFVQAQSTNDVSILCQLMSSPDVVAMLYRDKIMFDDFEALQLNWMVKISIGCQASQLIEHLPDLFAQQLKARGEHLSANIVSQSNIVSLPMMTQAVTPLNNWSGKTLNKDDLRQLRADPKRFDHVKIHYDYNELGTDTVQVFIRIDSRSRSSDRHALRPPSAVGSARSIVALLTPAEQAVEDIATLTDVVSFIHTAAPELGIKDISYPVIKDDNTRGVVSLPLSKKQLAPLVTLLKEWQFVGQATPVPAEYLTPMEQKSQVLQATASQFWKQVTDGSNTVWNQSAPHLRALMDGKALQQVKALMGPKHN
jgi:hypothetical protein